jgi:hypothetical protein
MPDNTTKIQTILDLVQVQSQHIASIPEMKTDIAVIKTKLEVQERRLSDVPTEPEVQVMISNHADKCQSEAPRKPVNWNLLLKIILVLLGLAGAVVGVNVI